MTTTVRKSRRIAVHFRISASEQGATSTIELFGEWDLAQQAARTDAIAQVLDRRPACLVLDLSRLSLSTPPAFTW